MSQQIYIIIFRETPTVDVKSRGFNYEAVDSTLFINLIVDAFKNISKQAIFDRRLSCSTSSRRNKLISVLTSGVQLRGLNNVTKLSNFSLINHNLNISHLLFEQFFL